MTAITAARADTAPNPLPHSSADSANTHVVERGDTLSAIAERNGVSLQALIKANPQIVNPDLIYPGDALNIPGGAQEQEQAPAAGADAQTSSAAPSAAPTQSGSAAATGAYTVKSGDTLWDIAKNNGVPLNKLIAANPQIANPNLIYPGDKINVPGGGGNGTAGTSGANGTNGTGNGSSPVGATTGSTAPNGNNAADIARQFLGENASSLKRSGKLPMNPNVPSDICCANFVSACLQKAGMLPNNLHTDSVSTLNNTLRQRGWHEVNPANAKPGDVVIIQSHGVSHTVMVESNNNGKLTLIGSNNRNPDGSQRITNGSADWALSHGGVILTPPGK
jgi:spore coat assembly protein SafA